MINHTLGSPAGNQFDARLDMLQQQLAGGSRGNACGGSAASRGLRPVGSAETGRMTARMAGSSIVQTPRSHRGVTPMLGTSMVGTPRLGSAGQGSYAPSSSFGGISSVSKATSMLRSELEKETRRRQEAENELRRLQTSRMVSFSDVGSDC